MSSQSRILRHLGSVLRGEADAKGRNKALAPGMDLRGTAGDLVPPELTGHRYAILLLYVAAEIEHVLMVEYLYAAYSLGGPQVPAEHRPAVAQWQETILGIAKEEMGHLMTVQNMLRCLGGPLNLDREDYPWDSDYYPFPFRLERLTRKSLAKYVFAESPEPGIWTGPEADEIKALAESPDDPKGEDRPPTLHRVGELYAQLQILFEDEDALRDADFRAATYPYQANWDEWGRGYQAGERGNTMGAMKPRTPDVILRPVTARTDALAALKAVATQGEANPTAADDAPSHFARFLEIYRQFPKDGSWTPTRDVPPNPIVTTSDDPTGSDGTTITHPQSRRWAHLFNVRYQLLLTNLLHSFEYPSNLLEASQMTPRGLLLHSTFGEMYNIRSLSQVLVQQPLTEDGSARRAGPPFQMPFTLKPPVDPADRWRNHLDLLRASKALAEEIEANDPGPHRGYLVSLAETDRQTMEMIEAILGGHPLPTPAVRRNH